jgi:hypothetical protein
MKDCNSKKFIEGYDRSQKNDYVCDHNLIGKVAGIGKKVMLFDPHR